MSVCQFQSSHVIEDVFGFRKQWVYLFNTRWWWLFCKVLYHAIWIWIRPLLVIIRIYVVITHNYNHTCALGFGEMYSQLEKCNYMSLMAVLKSVGITDSKTVRISWTHFHLFWSFQVRSLFNVCLTIWSMPSLNFYRDILRVLSKVWRTQATLIQNQSRPQPRSSVEVQACL